MFDSSHNRDGDSVDFLIVRGGAAGSVLGARLSEDSSVRVLLLEAGPDYAATHDVPEDLLDADGFPSSDEWGYQSEPGALGRSIPVPRAKVIGGSTTHNAAAAGRGHTTLDSFDLASIHEEIAKQLMRAASSARSPTARTARTN